MTELSFSSPQPAFLKGPDDDPVVRVETKPCNDRTHKSTKRTATRTQSRPKPMDDMSVTTSDETPVWAQGYTSADHCENDYLVLSGKAGPDAVQWAYRYVAEVTQIEPYGIFLELADGIEGMAHKSKLPALHTASDFADGDLVGVMRVSNEPNEDGHHKYEVVATLDTLRNLEVEVEPQYAPTVNLDPQEPESPPEPQSDDEFIESLLPSDGGVDDDEDEDEVAFDETVPVELPSGDDVSLQDQLVAALSQVDQDEYRTASELAHAHEKTWQEDHNFDRSTAANRISTQLSKMHNRYGLPRIERSQLTGYSGTGYAYQGLKGVDLYTDFQDEEDEEDEFESEHVDDDGNCVHCGHGTFRSRGEISGHLSHCPDYGDDAEDDSEDDEDAFIQHEGPSDEVLDQFGPDRPRDHEAIMEQMEQAVDLDDTASSKPSDSHLSPSEDSDEVELTLRLSREQLKSLLRDSSEELADAALDALLDQ